MALTKPRIGQLNTSVSASSDPITVLNQGSTTANADVGFLFNRANGLVSNVALYWSESANSFVTSFTSNSGVTNSNISPSSYANLTIGSLLSINGNIYLNGVAGTNGQYIAQTSNGTSWITTGGFDGGYVVNQSTFGSNLIAASATTSTSTTTGALVVVGGAGITGTLYSYSLNTGAVTSSGTIIASTVNAGTIGNISANHVGTGTYLTSLNATNLSSGTVSSLLIPTLNQNTTGSAATLTTSRSINGTAFNGSADITVTAAASTLTGATLASGVTASSLTSVGTLSSLAVGAVTSSGTIIASTVNAGTIGNISANHVGTGTYLTSLNATNLSSGTVASAQISGSYTGITGVGALAAGSITTGFTTIPVAQGGTGVTSSTGSGNNVLSTSPTLVTPVLGTPASGTVTNLTGTASININGTVGATTPATGAFTTLSASGATTLSTTLGVTGRITGSLDVWAGGFAGGVGLATTSALLDAGSGTGLVGTGTALDLRCYNGPIRMFTNNGSLGLTISNAATPAVTIPGTLAVTGTTALSGFVGIGVAASVSNILEVAGDIRLQGGNNSYKFNNGLVEFKLSQVAGATAAASLNASLAVTGTLSATTTGQVGTTLGVGAATPSASGSGITFPATQSASTNANTLDDYEEGTWTPNVNGASVGSFSTKTGYYVKTGKQVTCWFVCDGGNTGAGGATQYVTNLPFNITSAINNSIMGQMGVNGPATRTLDLMALNANFGVAYVYTGGSQEQTAISFASGCFTYGVD